MQAKLISPLYVHKNKRGDKWYLNLNNYRNTHFQRLNQVKKKYKEVMTPQIKSLPLMSNATITYVIYPASKQLLDIMNVGSIIDKFFCDAVTELGRIEDDNYTFIPHVSVDFGEVDKSNPRCEVLLEFNMKVIVTQEEMVQAVIAQFGLPEGTEVVLDKLMEVAKVVNEPVTTTVEPTKTKRKRRTKAEIEADASSKTTEELSEAESVLQEVPDEKTLSSEINGVEDDSVIDELENTELDSIEEVFADSGDTHLTEDQAIEDDIIFSVNQDAMEELKDEPSVIGNSLFGTTAVEEDKIEEVQEVAKPKLTPLFG